MLVFFRLVDFMCDWVSLIVHTYYGYVKDAILFQFVRAQH